MDKKNILITGGCGFIGSNFINLILESNTTISIINIDRLDYCAREDNVLLNSNYTFIQGDINDKDIVMRVLKQYDIEYIIHFAAQTHVDNSFGQSMNYTIDNILGTHTLLECSRHWGKIKKFIHISTDEVYGEVDINHTGCCEKSLLNPTNPYAATKAGAEFIARSYYHSFGIPLIITRANNVYGPRQYPEKLIPKFIMLLQKGNKMTIQGKGDTRRNFIHAIDVSNAIMMILDKGEIGNIYNIGTDNEYSVMDIAKILLRLIKGDEEVLSEWIEYVPDRNFNDFRYAINSDSLKDLGWKENIEFMEGLKSTVDWYLKNCEKYSL